MKYQKIYRFDATTDEFFLYNRDSANEVGFSTDILSNSTALRLAQFCEQLFKDAYEQGQQDLATAIRSALPTEEKP